MSNSNSESGIPPRPSSYSYVPPREPKPSPTYSGDPYAGPPATPNQVVLFCGFWYFMTSAYDLLPPRLLDNPAQWLVKFCKMYGFNMWIVLGICSVVVLGGVIGPLMIPQIRKSRWIARLGWPCRILGTFMVAHGLFAVAILLCLETGLPRIFG